jgi:hypothetical protein
MKLREMGFRDYYHNYVVLEADALTEECSRAVTVKEQDCFILCSSFIDGDGSLRFHVLSIGQEWHDCEKGLCKEEILGEFTPEQLAGLEARTVEPTQRMIDKNSAFLAGKYQDVPSHLMETRENTLLDTIRDDFYPDVVKAGFIEEAGIREYDMRLCRFSGPFAEGVLLEDSQEYAAGTVLRTLPYSFGSEDHRLLVVFAGALSSENRLMYERLKEQGARAGVCLGSYEKQELN